jgi:chromosome segregation ATPase
MTDKPSKRDLTDERGKEMSDLDHKNGARFEAETEYLYQKKIDEIKAHNEQQARLIDKLSQERAAFEVENNERLGHINHLKYDNERIKLFNDDLLKQLDEMKTENIDFLERLETVNSTNKLLASTLHLKDERIAALEAENKRLKDLFSRRTKKHWESQMGIVHERNELQKQLDEARAEIEKLNAANEFLHSESEYKGSLVTDLRAEMKLYINKTDEKVKLYLNALETVLDIAESSMGLRVPVIIDIVREVLKETE